MSAPNRQVPEHSKSAAILARLESGGSVSQVEKKTPASVVAEAAEACKPERVASRLEVVRRLYPHGFRFFPLNMKTNGKEPRTGFAGWADFDFNPSLDQCEKWAREGNLGIPSGGRMVFLDVDKPDDPAVQECGATRPREGPRVTSGKGYHVWLMQPKGESLGNSEGDLPEGINVRGARGYVVAPESWHYERRRPYTFADEFDPAQLVEVPAQVVARLKASKRHDARGTTAAVLSDEEAQARDAAMSAPDRERVRSVVLGLFQSDVERVRSAAPGTSQNTYYAAVCNLGNYLSGGIVTEEEASAQVEALVNAAHERGVEGIEATLDSGMGMGASKPRYAFQVLEELEAKDESLERQFKGLRLAHREERGD